MTQQLPEMSDSDLARWRGALVATLPADHLVQDPRRAFTYAELERFEQELMDRIDRG